MARKERPQAVRVAIIALIGAILTACGGVAGAVISNAVAIYRVERQRQQVSLPASGSDQALNVDTGSIFISRQEAAALDPETHFVDLDRGLALHRPFPGWGELEELTLAEVLIEEGADFSPSPISEQPVYRIRYGEPIEIQSDRETLINGQPMPEQMVEMFEQFYGPPPWTVPYYSQIVVNVFEGVVEEEMDIDDLPDFLLTTMHFSNGRVNQLVTEEGSDVIMVQSSATYDGVRMAGEQTTVAVENWFTYARVEDVYYVVEIVYTPQSGQPMQIWEDLQAYVNSFRVIK